MVFQNNGLSDFQISQDHDFFRAETESTQIHSGLHEIMFLVKFEFQGKYIKVFNLNQIMEFCNLP